MPADVEYRAELDDSQVLTALKNIDRNMDKLANEGDKSFKKVGQSAKKAGVTIGATAGIVQELTRRFINMGQQAARALLQIAKGGIELNRSMELLEVRVTSILEGNQVAAQAFLTTAREAARELKLDYIELSELATIILPDAKDLEVSAKLAGQALLLARAIGADAKRARISIVEALAGQFVSIRRVLNLSSAQVEKIKELAPEIGRAAAISQVLGDRLEAIGFDAEKIADTFVGLFGLLQTEAKQLQQTFAEPIFEELKDQAQAFLEVFDEHGDDIERVAVAFGQFLADVVELVGTNLVDFLDALDYQQLEDAADALADMVATTDLFIQLLTQGDINDTLELITTTIERMTAALRTASQIVAIINAEFARRGAIEESLTEQGRGFDVFLSQAEIEDRAKGQEAYNEVMAEQAKLFEELDERLDENRRRSEERGEVIKDNTQAATDEAKALLEWRAAMEELEQAANDAAEAQEKIGDRMQKLAIESGRRLTEIMLDNERERIEDAIDAAQKREDIARENAEKIEDIFRKHEQGIADAARDLSRKEEDIARKASRDRAEVERDSANERVDIEREYRRELQRIRDRFNESAEEAERRNDAQAFLEAVRQKDREINEAKRGREERLEDASLRAAEQRENLKQQLEFELEDAKIANRRKLEDLQLRLDRELEAQRISYQRDLDEQTLNEDRKKAERDRAYAQELEDHARKEGQRVADLRKSLGTEFEAVKKHEDLKREYRVNSMNRTVAEVNAAMSRLNPFGSRSSSSSYADTLGATYGRQEGGPVEVGKPYIVGERGPELFIPAMSGNVLPNQAIGLPAAPGAANVSNVSTTVSPTFNVAESLFNDPVAVRKLQNLMLGVLTEAL
jgi:hypothetical protein